MLTTYRKLLFISVLTISFFFQAQSKAPSGCGVVASFYPGVDTFFTSSQSITFTSTSINANSVEWRINGLYESAANLVTRNFDPGVHKVSLIAKNGICTDTFSILVVCTGVPPVDRNYFSGVVGIDGHVNNGSAITQSSDSGVLIAGSTSYQATSYQQLNGLLIKLKKQNCVEWTRLIALPNSNVRIFETIGLKDGGFLVCGDAGYTPFVMRINSTGQLQWLKNYTTALALGSIQKVYELKDGSLVLALYQNGGSAVTILKLDGAGNVLWNRLLLPTVAPTSHLYCRAILEMDDAIYITGTFQDYVSPFVYGGFLPFIAKLDLINGQEKWATFYRSGTNRSTTFQILQQVGNRIFASGIDYIAGGSLDPMPCMLYFDTSGNILSSGALKPLTAVKSWNTASGGVLPGGNIFLHFKNTRIPPVGLERAYSNYILLDAAMNIIREQEIGVQENANTAVRFTGYGFVSTGSLYGSSILPWINTPENIQFHKQDSTGIQGNCARSYPAFTSQAFSLQKQTLTWILDTSLTISNAAPPSLQLIETFAAIKSLCPVYVDSCSVLMVKGPSSICNLSKTYTYKAGRNKQCPQAVEWSYTGNLSVVTQTDSSLSVRYNQGGNYTIKAILKNSCTPVADSMQITVVPPALTLNLGADRELCTGNSFVVRASPLFTSYRWQDGSTDSVFNVTTPGLYWVETTDNCENVWRDSVLVTAATGFSINAGPDRTKCNADTIQLSAPAGYRSYKWTASNNLSFSDTARRIVVNPLQSTQYYLQAEQNAGCFGFDTIAVMVYQSPAVNLGEDTSICAGDSLQLTAPAGFVTYLWNNGSAASTINASLPGNYSLQATTSNGCKSFDTLRIISNYAKPVVNIIGNNVLCTGTNTQLDAGLFNGAGYVWNTGDITRTISVNSTGLYSVLVTDANGCSTTDSFSIDRFVDPPQNFLPADTSICTYSKLELKGNGIFRSYLWSTNDVAAGITVNSAGLYTLTVTDATNCVGTDSIRVDLKDCLRGSYIPTAFTPNRDGLNDVFKPLLFGDVVFYELMVYNRWGKLIFSSKETDKGWDGTVAGVLQNTGSYAWVCRYAFAGETTETKTGTVLLIR